jgi:hypothetical protein
MDKQDDVDPPRRNRMTGPGGREASLSVSREKFIFEIFRFQEGGQEKLALSGDGC